MLVLCWSQDQRGARATVVERTTWYITVAVKYMVRGDSTCNLSRIYNTTAEGVGQQRHQQQLAEREAQRRATRGQVLQQWLYSVPGGSLGFSLCRP